MKRTIATVITTVIVTAAIALALFAGCAKKNGTVKQTASAYLDQDGNTITVTVDLTDGYSCDFSRGAVYLIDDKGYEGVYAITLDEIVYEEDLAIAKADPDSKEINGGIMYSEDGQMRYICTVGDSAYFGIFAEKITPAQMEKIIARFTAVPEYAQI